MNCHQLFIQHWPMTKPDEHQQLLLFLQRTSKVRNACNVLRVHLCFLQTGMFEYWATFQRLQRKRVAQWWKSRRLVCTRAMPCSLQALITTSSAAEPAGAAMYSTPLCRGKKRERRQLDGLQMVVNFLLVKDCCNHRLYKDGHGTAPQKWSQCK